MGTFSLFAHMFIMRGLKLDRWNQMYRKGEPVVPDHEYDALLQIWNRSKMELGDYKKQYGDTALWKTAREISNQTLF